MYDYNYGYDYTVPGFDSSGINTGGFTDLFGNILGSIAIIAIISLAVTILLVISNWKIFEKAKRTGWESLVPVHNIFVLLEIAGTPTWHIFLFFVPFANIYAIFRMFIDLAHKFGKSTGFGVLTVFFSVICLPILAFSKNIKYNSGESVEQTPTNNNIETPQVNAIEQSVNMAMPLHNQVMNTTENLEQIQNSEITNEMPINYNANDMNQDSMYSQPTQEPTNIEVPMYNENVNNIENIMPVEPIYPEQMNNNQQVQAPLYTESLNTMENTMTVETPEIIVPIETQNIPQEPVYPEQIQTQPMEFNQQVQEPILSQPVQQPLPNMVQESVMPNQMVMPEQINNNQNGTIM